MSSATGVLMVFNPTRGTKIVKVIQYYQVLRFINIADIPDTFFNLLAAFRKNFYDIIPNPIDVDETDQVAVKKLKEIKEDQKINPSNRVDNAASSSTANPNNKITIKEVDQLNMDFGLRIDYCKLNPIFKKIDK